MAKGQTCLSGKGLNMFKSCSVKHGLNLFSLLKTLIVLLSIANLVQLLKVFKTESNTKLSNFNFQWTKTLPQNNFKHVAFFFLHFSRAINVIRYMKLLQREDSYGNIITKTARFNYFRSSRRQVPRKIQP